MCTLFRQVSSASSFDGRPPWVQSCHLPVGSAAPAGHEADCRRVSTMHQRKAPVVNIFLICCSGYVAVISEPFPTCGGYCHNHTNSKPRLHPQVSYAGVFGAGASCLLSLVVCGNWWTNLPVATNRGPTPRRWWSSTRKTTVAAGPGRAAPKSWTFKRPPICQSSWKKSACKTARSRAQLKVVGRDSGSPKATLRVWRRIFGAWAGFLVIFPKSSSRLLPSSGCNWFAVGCCGPLLCGESSRIHVEHCWAKSRVEPLRIIHVGVQGVLELGLPLILVGASEKQCWKKIETGYPGL